MATYQIFTDATADMSTDLLSRLPAVKIIPMKVEIEGCDYTYGPSGNISVQEFTSYREAETLQELHKSIQMFILNILNHFYIRGSTSFTCAFLRACPVRSSLQT